MKGLPRSLARGGHLTRQHVSRQVVKVEDVTLTVTGVEASVNFQTAVIGDVPEGNILLLGATAYLTFTGPTSDELADDWEGDFSIGSAPDADGSLAGSEVDIIPSTAIAAATAEVSPRTRGVNATAIMLDNTDGSLELNLNLLIDDAEITDTEDVVITVNGELQLAYIVLGDD